MGLVGLSDDQATGPGADTPEAFGRSKRLIGPGGDAPGVLGTM